MNKIIKSVLISGAVVAAMCTGLAATPAHAYVYAAGGFGGVRVGVGVGGARVGVGVGGVRVGVGYRGCCWRAVYGVRVGYPAVRVGYPAVRVAPVFYPVPVIVGGPPMPAEPFGGHG